ncbi:MAG: hypothetical protein DI604_20200 [Delftia acidovorans]|nr:MAG: hypothetical protein DI604_20200 [Delftia acidovorans]
MATATAYLATDMGATSSLAGTVIAATPEQIILSGFNSSVTYLGFGFTYSDTTVVSGTLTGFYQYVGGRLAQEAYGLSVPAPLAAAFIQSGNFAGLLPIALSGNDKINGSPFSDVLYGYNGNDVINAGRGSNIVDGGNGTDALILSRPSSSYKITSDGISTFVNSTDGLEMNTLRSIERYVFTDQTLATGPNASQGYRLYQAAFDRTPDKAGLSYWVSQLDKGATLQTVANSFIGSAEFAQKFGAAPSNAQLVAGLYQNVLHRQPDQAGASFWISKLDSGMTKADVLISFSESAENVGNTSVATAGGVWLNSNEFLL